MQKRTKRLEFILVGAISSRVNGYCKDRLAKFEGLNGGGGEGGGGGGGWVFLSC